MILDTEFAATADYAQYYRSLGWTVVPALSPGEGKQGQWKRPAVAWREYQSGVPDDVWQEWYGPQGQFLARLNVGLLTGKRAFVVDIDLYKTPAAAQWWANVLALHNSAMDLETVSQRTGGGGRQLFFSAPPGWTPPTGKTPIGIDIRGIGGFAMLPPSRHESGRAYEWEDGREPSELAVMEAPSWLCAEIDKLIVEHGGQPAGGTTAQKTGTPATSTSAIAGLVRDGREDFMTRHVWGWVLNLRRDAPQKPMGRPLEDEIAEAFQAYVRKVKTRLVEPGTATEDLLEREGRGITAYREKWAAAMALWDTKVAEYAELPAPAREVPEQATKPRAKKTPAHDSETGEIIETRRAGLCVQIAVGNTLQPEPIDWLWPNWLASGKLHLLAGAPGSGKTTIAVSLAAAVTSGGKWPDGQPVAAGDVVVWSGEDGVTDTLLPRFLAGGGDAKRVHFVLGTNNHGEPGPFDPAHHMPALEKAVRDLGAKLVIIDPVVSAVSADSHKNTEVRRGLQPVVDLAERTGCAVVGISHLSKGTAGRDPVERVSGSIAFGAVARVVLATVKPADPDAQRRLVRAKSNIGLDNGGLEYNLGRAPVPDHAFDAQVVTWGRALEGTARELMAVEEPASGDETAAVAFLADALAEGPVSVKDLKVAAKEQDLGWRSIERAKAELGVRAVKLGMKQGWTWELPAEPSPADDKPEAEGPPVAARLDTAEAIISRMMERANRVAGGPP